MLRKGISVRQKNMKTLVHTVFSSVAKGPSCLRELFREMFASSPNHMLTMSQSEILIEGNQSILV